MKVYLNNVHRMVKYNSLLRWQMMKIIRLFLVKENILNVEMGVILSGDDHLAHLNEKYRREEGATDVLSFTFDDNGETETSGVKRRQLLGEIYISVDRALARIEETGDPLEKEILYLLAHGLYHLLGFDHADDPGRREMEMLVEDLVGEAF